MTTAIRSDATSSTIVVNGVDQLTIKDTGVITARTKGASGNDVVVMSQITGTVSQTAGLPTGAIIETGTNANGTYTKWADGTMICTRSVSVGSIGFSAAGSLFLSSVQGSVATAANFIAAPICSITVQSASGQCNCTVSSFATSSLYPAFYISSGSTAGTTVSYQLMAIGRWF